MKHWKRFFSVTMCAALFLFPGCSLAEEADPEPPVRSDTGAASSVPDASSEEESSVPMKPVQRIDMRTAKANLDADEAIVLLDVRTKTVIFPAVYSSRSMSFTRRRPAPYRKKTAPCTSIAEAGGEVTPPPRY